MQSSSVTIAVLALLLAGCASTPPTVSSTTETGVVGTWQWIRVDQQPVKEQFYVRYYPDGTAATWPAPKGWPTTVRGVSRGRYHLDGDFLVLETGAGKNDPKSRMEIKGNEMFLSTGESNTLIYHRIVPPLEPGKLRSGSK